MRLQLSFEILNKISNFDFGWALTNKDPKIAPGKIKIDILINIDSRVTKFSLGNLGSMSGHIVFVNHNKSVRILSQVDKNNFNREE